MVDAAARPGPGLEARALDAGVRGAAPLVRLARLRLPVSAPVSVAPPPLPLALPLPLPALLRDDGRGCNKKGETKFPRILSLHVEGDSKLQRQPDFTQTWSEKIITKIKYRNYAIEYL